MKRAPDGHHLVHHSRAPAQPETLGEHIKRRRLNLHLLQRQVAAQLGVNLETLKNWERSMQLRLARMERQE
jgi:DNA-binding transcriptional regulator YiaG